MRSYQAMPAQQQRQGTRSNLRAPRKIGCSAALVYVPASFAKIGDGNALSSQFDGEALPALSTVKLMFSS